MLYYQKALDYALAEQDSSLIGALYHDLAMVYNEKKDYVQADKYVSTIAKSKNSRPKNKMCH